MSETDPQIVRPTDPVGRALFFFSYLFAILGGLIMSAIATMVVVSVLGRYLISKPIFGDFEMVAMGTAVSVCLFLPYCHLNRGNVIVDLFMAWAPKRVQSFLDVIGALALGVIAAMLCWRMVYGTADMINYNEMTYILALPLWWAFPFFVLAFGLLAISCLYTAIVDLKSIFQ